MVKKTEIVKEIELVKEGRVDKETTLEYSPLTEEQLLYAVKRNFDGLDKLSDEESLKKIFIDKCKMFFEMQSYDEDDEVLFVRMF